ncbi:MAG TPA: hypothetical protein DCL95_17775 [Rhodospirillaceae bacterium]|nr:hypothetical protein [Rhodospirillaceae bacterium]
MHMRAWKQGVKSLYYCRSKSIQRAEADDTVRIKASGTVSLPFAGLVNAGEMPKAVQPDYEECLSCQ